MSNYHYRFMVTGRPGDSPEVGPTTLMDEVVSPDDHPMLIQAAQTFADYAWEANRDVLLTELDSVAVRVGYQGDVLCALMSHLPDYDPSTVYKNEITHDTTWVTTLRIYCEDEYL